MSQRAEHVQLVPRAKPGEQLSAFPADLVDEAETAVFRVTDAERPAEQGLPAAVDMHKLAGDGQIRQFPGVERQRKAVWIKRAGL